MELKTIVFDFDGTLAHLNIDFEEMRRRVIALLPEFGLAVTLMRDRYLLEGIEAGLESLKERGGNGASLFETRAEEAMLSLEWVAAQESFLLPGVPEALLALKARGLGLGIITRNSAAAVQSVLSRHHLVYDVLLSREDVGRDKVKPHPEHLEKALGMLRGSAPACLMVGDHPLDIRVAKAVGARSAGVLTGRHQAADFQGEGADLILESVAELPRLFDRGLLRSLP